MYIKGCPALIDFVIFDLPEDATAPIILGRRFLRAIKVMINLHEGNVKLQLPLWYPLVVHSPGRRKPGMMRRRASL